MPMEERTIKRTPANLTPDERVIWLHLPPDLQQAYIASLPPLVVKDRQRNRKLKIVNSRILLLRQIVAAMEDQSRQLNIAWARLNQGEAVDLKPLLEPPRINGVTIRFARTREEEEDRAEKTGRASTSPPNGQDVPPTVKRDPGQEFLELL